MGGRECLRHQSGSGGGYLGELYRRTLSLLLTRMSRIGETVGVGLVGVARGS